eukprot:120182-Pyramimonas_sp.AAC.1
MCSGRSFFEILTTPAVLKGSCMRARRRARVHFAQFVAGGSCDSTGARAFGIFRHIILGGGG